jgi:hypothetical protein
MTQRFFKSVLSAASLAIALSAITGATHANAQAAPAPAATSSKPDFSGTWKVNLTKSQFSPAPAPSAETTTLTLSGDDLTIAFDSSDENGKQKYTHALKIGGPEVTFTTPSSSGPLLILSSKAEWKDNSIIVTDKITYQGGAGWIVSTYTLSPDGKTLTKAFSASIEQGTFDMLAVYDKG